VRVAHNEISVCHTEATKAVLMAPLQKVRSFTLSLDKGPDSPIRHHHEVCAVIMADH
jgi:hypothetical protein